MNTWRDVIEWFLLSVLAVVVVLAAVAVLGV